MAEGSRREFVQIIFVILLLITSLVTLIASITSNGVERLANFGICCGMIANCHIIIHIMLHDRKGM